MEALLGAYKAGEPEIVFEWQDRETSAKGWIVINSLRNGAAGGGTRMRKGLTKSEVISLAKVMEIKFSVPGSWTSFNFYDCTTYLICREIWRDWR